MLSKVPLPEPARWAGLEVEYEQDYQSGLWLDMARAHAAVGLLGECCEPGTPSDRAYVWPSLAPIKDMEIVVLGSHAGSPALARALHAALRVLIDDLHVCTFNVGIFNLSVAEPTNGSQSPRMDGTTVDELLRQSSRTNKRPVVARIVSRGKLSSKASDFGGLEVFAGASIGHTDPFTISAALHNAAVTASEIS
eukprot:TRINITY_DN45392_c0_g1_i2.p1 TRINITY_DN45392_c0_g1~~TRINITY_DN45392_c0_g1_i2.p1  ORF type:complete len:194 (-),score=16.42 TRINITY_DN45392_c0_g1_i2:89-670(-)